MIVNYIGAFTVIMLGLYMILVKKNPIKIIQGLFITDSGINLLIISFGFREGTAESVFGTAAQRLVHTQFIDPIPQAITIISIVISACVTVFSFSLIIKLNAQYDNINSDNIRRKNG